MLRNGNYRAAAIRETLEEVGVQLRPEDLEHAYTLQRYEVGNGDVRVDIFFDAKEWEGEPTNVEPHKHSELAWFSLEEMPDEIMGYQADVLRAIARGGRYHERGWEA